MNLPRTAAGQTVTDSAVFFQQAETHVASGRYLEALGLYQTVADIAADPAEKARAMLMVGFIYTQYLDQHEKAQIYFDYILSTWPQTPAAEDAMYRKGMVLYQAERYDQAFDVFTAYQNRYPESRRGHSARVWAESALNLAATRELRMKRESLALARKDTAIRVLIAEKENAVEVASNQPFIIAETASGRSLFQAKRAVIGVSGGRLVINNRRLETGSCRLTPRQGETLAVNQTRYRGHVVAFCDVDGVSVVNHVDIEPYLYGVVPREVPASWPMQALMAQAVASRTYALYIKQKSEDQPYDVKATVASQMYGGYDAEMPGTSQAVDATRGQVMTYNGNLIVAYFHANSGGYTEGPENVWGAALPYLAARPDRYSDGAPGGTWEYYLPYEEAQRQLGRYGIHVSGVRGLLFNGKSTSGRVRDVSVVSDAGTWNMSGNSFRLAIGSTKLKSMCFDASRQGQGVLFQGAGYGHGVGMSQWGARKMALEGQDYKTILHHYYRGIAIASLQQP
ncbi:MAG: SpoIID/LytB domain-containing protein [Thermodesulfobacteriota bacterium]